MNKLVVEKFKTYFTQMDFDNGLALAEMYANNVVFKDPIHEIFGIENLTEYFNRLNDNLIEGTFLFTDESMIGNKAFLCWEMTLKLRRPKKKVTASGISVLTIEEKIIRQRDYFDAGELFYEHIPVLGGVIRFLKKKIANR